MERATKSRLAAVLLLSSALAGSALAQGQQADVLITGGTIYDGSDAKPFTGDVAITGDKITYVGPHANVTAKRTIDAHGMIVSPGLIDAHTHADRFLDAADKEQRSNAAWTMQGVSTVFIGVDGAGTPNLKDHFAKLSAQGVGTNIVSYVGFGAIRKAVIGDAARAPTPAELDQERALAVKGMCEGAIGFSTGLFYAPQNFARTDEVIALAKEAGKRGGIYDTHQRDESSYSIGLMNSSKEVLQIGREGGIPVHFSHIKALGHDVWGKSKDLIALIDDARAHGQNVTANNYPWLASNTGLDAALIPRWASDGGAAAMLKRFDDPALMARIKTEMAKNLDRRGGAQTILMSAAISDVDKVADAPPRPWTGKYLSDIAKDWKMDPLDAAIRILRETKGHASVISFNINEADLENFMKQPWVVTSSDGSAGHPREYATFPTKYAVYVKQRHVIDTGFFIRHSSGLTADIFKLDRRGYLRNGYFADVLVFDPNRYVPKADYVHPAVLSQGVQELFVNGVAAVDNGKPTGSTSGRPLPHTPPAGTCR
ncbi:MAG TPA: amidohydrolase family protein [Rhizomicrobium sp.]|jgi:N-acyl-D-aspartate/D-glutamate deacylase|nr:amidohydrolase family protein [Rhizomicrobium sp.]